MCAGGPRCLQKEVLHVERFETRIKTTYNKLLYKTSFFFSDQQTKLETYIMWVEVVIRTPKEILDGVLGFIY